MVLEGEVVEVVAFVGEAQVPLVEVDLVVEIEGVVVGGSVAVEVEGGSVAVEDVGGSVAVMPVKVLEGEDSVVVEEELVVVEEELVVGEVERVE